MRTFVLAALLLVPLPSAANILDDCDGSNAVMTECIWSHYRDADAELNRVWRDVLATIEGADYLPANEIAAWRDELVQAQRAWVQFKEHDCEGAVAYEWYGGSGADAAVGACLYSHTRARIDDLIARYEDR
jgi:uncharacterized protein YecT (DUF1311 family)